LRQASSIRRSWVISKADLAGELQAQAVQAHRRHAQLVGILADLPLLLVALFDLGAEAAEQLEIAAARLVGDAAFGLHPHQQQQGARASHSSIRVWPWRGQAASASRCCSSASRRPRIFRQRAEVRSRAVRRTAR
jgi:hypothetical protein